MADVNTESDKGNRGCGCLSVGFITFIAFVIGFGGHKDFPESLFSNLCFALIDVTLWTVAILYWLDVAKVHWQALKANPTRLGYFRYYVRFGVLAVAYGAGVLMSIVGLMLQAARSDTTF